MATTNTSGTKSSCGIVKFWQGIVELVLRAVVIVLSIGLLVSSALVVSEDPDCFTCTVIIVAYWLLLASVISILGECFSILARFFNLEFLMRHGKARSRTDAGGSIFLAICLVVGGSVLASDTSQAFNNSTPTIVFCFLLVPPLMGLGVWMFLFLFYKWDDKLNQDAAAN